MLALRFVYKVILNIIAIIRRFIEQKIYKVIVLGFYIKFGNFFCFNLIKNVFYIKVEFS